ncbi:shufflon domain protein [Solidesulfovibrio carbinoliphilus subsp. oakridgensis]|uniref:Shufflon domain protein n=1 Tax=Solidesulfovibrio carbinoliphilus subsp. oakridgensis TaxID=694327 RepID=G7QB77_9BACT|nr:shufflon system plasmid conjugative transfer pilus tip adhesin PilV [Solidesulfovibrio carbinoliphilus]EHJ48819.1 shufflon domain protein [Solidesulfovibrio carbinoliphilus subsp. oakridgensis]
MKLIETIGALLILAIMLPVLFNLWSLGSNEIEKRQAADQLAAVTKAAAGYVRKHQTDLLAQATASSGPSISTDPLVAEGFLQDGFQGHNVWGQTYQISFRQPSANALQAIILTTGGRGQDTNDPRFASALVPSAAAMVGGSGGYIPTGDVPGQSPDSLRGAFGGWIVTLANFGIASPGAGHLGALTTFDSSSLGQDFLYRVAVPGHAELNAMQTDLDMTDHSIRNVHELQFTVRTLDGETCDESTEGRTFLDKDQGLYLCRNGKLEVIGDSGNSFLLKNATLAKDGDLITKPVCAPGTETAPQIFVAPSLAAAGAEAPPITAFQAWAISKSETEWEVHLRLLTTDDNLGWINPGSDYGRIMVCTLCGKGN